MPLLSRHRRKAATSAASPAETPREAENIINLDVDVQEITKQIPGPSSRRRIPDVCSKDIIGT